MSVFFLLAVSRTKKTSPWSESCLFMSPMPRVKFLKVIFGLSPYSVAAMNSTLTCRSCSWSSCPPTSHLLSCLAAPIKSASALQASLVDKLADLVSPSTLSLVTEAEHVSELSSRSVVAADSSLPFK